MRSSNRTSGIDIIGNVPWGTHFCQLYQTKEDLMEIIIPYFKAGLENNEFCLWVLSDQLDEEKAKEALKLVVSNIETYIENGQIEIIPYTYWHIEEGSSDPQAALDHLIIKIGNALASGYDGLRYGGNSFFCHDKVLDSVISKHSVIALCTYSLDMCSSIDIVEIATSHQFVLGKKKGKWERIESSGKNSNKCEESEEEYKALFENSHDGIFITIPDGTILAANPAACQMFGMTEKEIIKAGRNGTVDTSDPRFKYFLEERARTGRFKGELNHMRGDGTIFPGEISSALFKDKNDVVRAVIIIRNITERKHVEEALCESEKRFRALVMASSEMVYNVSPDWSEMLYFYGRGFLANTESPSSTWIDKYVLPEDQPRVAAIINEAIRKKSTYQTEHRVRLASGSVGWIFSRAVPLLDANGEIVEWFGAASDITERKEAEAKLKETLDNLETLVKERTSELEKAYNSLKKSEKGFAEAQKMANIGNWEWNIAIDKAYWSDELYRIFGRDPQELAPPYNEFLNYVHPDDRNYVDNAAKKATKGKPYSIDYRIVLDNGEERTVHMQSEVIFDEENIPIRVKGTVQDITERKRTEERIQSLANVVESSQDAIVTVSLDGIVSSWNKGAEQVYGYSAEEILRKDVSVLAPDNLKDEAKKLIDRVKHGIKIKSYETSRLKKDGTIITVSITLSPVFDIHGKLTDISAIYRDITERKRVEEKLRESEEKYRNIVETANELILITDNEAVITYVNKRMEDMLGYRMEESIGRPIWGYISEECRPIVKTHLEKRRQGISESYELKLIRKDGSPLWTFLNVKPLFDKEGKYVGAMSMLTDITKRKDAEETLINIETARKKEIHHRIKNNLQVISSLLDLQAEQFRNREDIRDSEVLEAFMESQDRVISMALIHEELYKGGGFETLNFSPYIQELADTLFQTYRLGNTDISLNMDLEENLFFDMDTAVPLGIIINELVSNSLKHAFPGRDSGEIRIKLYREESTELKREDFESTCASFTLIISDNGVGIPENLDIEDLESLGMQLVTSLVDQLDGELELKRNNGTQFTIKFAVNERNE